MCYLSISFFQGVVKMKNSSKFLGTTTSVILLLCVLLTAVSCGKKTAETGPVELTFWDLRTEGVGAAMIDAIIANFQAANPNIRITRSAFGNEDLRATIKPAINSGEGPDIFSYDAGAGYLGVLANTGMALDLSPYAFYMPYAGKTIIRHDLDGYRSCLHPLDGRRVLSPSLVFEEGETVLPVNKLTNGMMAFNQQFDL
jgi:hypothetical protein